MADVDTLLIHVGIPNDATVYQKSTALHVCIRKLDEILYLICYSFGYLAMNFPKLF